MQEEHSAIDHLKGLEDKFLMARDCSYGRLGRSLGLALDRDCIGERTWEAEYGDTRQNKQMNRNILPITTHVLCNVARGNLDLSSRSRGADLRQTVINTGIFPSTNRARLAAGSGQPRPAQASHDAGLSIHVPAYLTCAQIYLSTQQNARTHPSELIKLISITQATVC